MEIKLKPDYKSIATTVSNPISKYLVKATDNLVNTKSNKIIAYDSHEVHTLIDLKLQNLLIEFINKQWPGKFGVVAEEHGYTKSIGKHVFFIDPLDGTRNFIAGNPLYTSSVGLWDIEASVPIFGAVYSPKSKQLYSWSYGSEATLNGEKIKTSKTKRLLHSIVGVAFLRDKKQFGSNWQRMGKYYSRLSQFVYGFRTLQCDSLSLCWVASGSLDGVFLPATRLFDVAGGLAILTGAGGKFIETTKSTSVLDWSTNKYIGICATNPYIFNRMSTLTTK